MSLLKHYFKTPEIDYDSLGLKTDGFVVQDLQNLYVKALFEAYKGVHVNLTIWNYTLSF